MNSEVNGDEQGLAVSDLVVRYGDVVAVDGVSLEVAAGEIVALLGPSGCGKSTLLRSIAGLLPLSGGSVAWNGKDLAGVPVHRRSFGLMFQDHALFPHHNVAENIGFGLRMKGMARPERARRVGDLLDLVGLGSLGERTVGTLSGGQAQRVALARAVAPEPALLLLDEPLGSLDRALRDRLVGEIRRVVSELGLTAIHVTHDHDEAMSVADRLALMERGVVTLVGPVSTLLSDPGDVATAKALGVDSVWPVEPDANGCASTPFGGVRGLARDTAAILVRPEAVRLSESGVPATVNAARYRDGAWLITCALSADAEIVARHADRVAEGTDVLVSVELDNVGMLVSAPSR